jgi:hypothetical protein
MAFMWKEDSSYNYKFELEDDNLTNKSSKSCMLQLGAATASNWGGNVFQLMLFKTRDSSSSQFHVRNNEFQTPDPYSFTPCSRITNPTKTIGQFHFLKLDQIFLV